MNSVYNGIETISFLGPNVGCIISSGIKGKESLGAFKRPIKKWKSENYGIRNTFLSSEL